MLESLNLHNFKSHRDSEFHFDDSRLHALVGQNDTGKTSVLQAINYLSKISRLGDGFYPYTEISKLDEVFVNQSSPDYIVTVGQNASSLVADGHGLLNGTKHQWKIKCSFDKNASGDSWHSNGEFKWKIPNESIDHPRWLYFHDYYPPKGITSAVHLKLASANLAKPTYSEEVVPTLEFDGTGLAPTLDYLRNEAPENFQALQERLKRVVPGVVKIGIRRAKVLINRQQLITVKGKSIPYDEPQEMVGQEVILDMATGERIPAHALSEGTVLALGLLTALHNPQKPSLLLLDDIEQGLHPKAQRDLMTVLKDIIQDSPDLQIIFSTHSPYIVDELAPSQVHVLSNTASGFTRCKRLDEHPDIEWAKSTLTTGEFWNAEGEDWVLAGETDD